MNKLPIIIAGGGIGGMTAALALLKKGFSVRLLERAPQLGEVGAGLQNSPNAVRVLYALGIGPEIEKTCYVPIARELRMWDTGIGPKRPTPNSEMITKYGYSHINMHRADLHSTLVQAVGKYPKGVIQLNAEVVGFTNEDNCVSVKLQTGEIIRGSALIGADGIHSKTRQQLYGVSEPKYTGAMVWRGTAPIEKLPAGMRNRNGETWVGPNGHISLYPIRKGQLINFVGHLDRPKWTEPGWIVQGSKAELASDFTGWHDEIQTIIGAIESPSKWGLFLRDTLPAWSEGRATLLGDACHPMLPYLGQGANMAIEDAFVLATCLEAYSEDLPEGLKKYAAARTARTARVVQLSANNVKYFRTPESLTAEQGTAWLSDSWASQMDLRDWIYSYDATSPDHANAGASMSAT